MEFIDLKSQLETLRPQIDSAIARVLDHGRFIMGPEVLELESRLADLGQSQYCVSCANGTDAIVLALRACGIGVGDAVIIPAFTFAATAEAVCNAGATPVFADVQRHTFNIDPDSVAVGIVLAKEQGLVPRAVMVVDLFGRPADYDAIRRIADEHGMLVIGDAAQSFGATLRGRPVGSIADITTTSFFPAKPLGCYGDGGAVFTDDSIVFDTLQSLRVHGKGGDKYDNIRVGYNSRLDTLQAAILLVKLNALADEISRKQDVASQYGRLLAETGEVMCPEMSTEFLSAWAQYTLVVNPARRDALASHLRERSIPTAIYYPKPLHKAGAYSQYPLAGGAMPVSSALSESVLSLPMHAYLSAAQIHEIGSAIEDFFSA